MLGPSTNSGQVVECSTFTKVPADAVGVGQHFVYRSIAQSYTSCNLNGFLSVTILVFGINYLEEIIYKITNCDLKAKTLQTIYNRFLVFIIKLSRKRTVIPRSEATRDPLVSCC